MTLTIAERAMNAVSDIKNDEIIGNLPLRSDMEEIAKKAGDYGMEAFLTYGKLLGCIAAGRMPNKNLIDTYRRDLLHLLNRIADICFY
jgi:hypothetical protein